MPEKKEIVTSLRVDVELWKEAKIEAIKRGVTLGKIVDKALRCELKKIEGIDTLKKGTEVK